MNKIKVTLALLFFFKALSVGQEVQRPEAKLVRSPFMGGNFADVMQEAAIDIKGHAGGPEDMAAIRICSKEPMPMALVIATASPFIMLEYLEHYDYSRDRILFLRSENCLGAKHGIAVTEFWAIPKGATPPASIEAIKASQVRLDVLRTRDTIKNDGDYNAALLKLSSKLQSNPRAIGVIVGFYYKSPSHLLKMNMRKVQRTLRYSKTQQGRYYSHLQKLTGPGTEWPSSSKSKYPDIFIIEVSNDSKFRL